MAVVMAKIPLKNIRKKTQSKNRPPALTTGHDQKWIDEAIASGPETPLTKKEMNAIRDRVLRGKK
jgi:hypothetical protein